MKLTTITCPAVELTKAEESELWEAYRDFKCGIPPCPTIEGKRITMWHTDDGENQILLEGESVFRQVVTVPEPGPQIVGDYLLGPQMRKKFGV